MRPSIITVVWSGTYSRKSFDLKEAYSTLKMDENAIRSYLLKKGIAAGNMQFSSVMINKEFSQQTNANGQYMSQEFTGYNLMQSVTIESNEVDKVDKISVKLESSYKAVLNSIAPHPCFTTLN